MQVEELAKAKLEHPKRLREVASRDWREIDDGTLRFDRQHEEVRHLQEIGPSDLITFFRENVVDVGKRRKFTVRIETSVDTKKPESTVQDIVNDEHVEYIEDVHSWKRRQMLFPSPK